MMHQIKRYGIIIFGLFLYAVGWRYFLEPHNVIVGGLYSVAIIMSNYMGLDSVVFAPHIYAMLNLFLVGVALKFLAKREILDIIFIGTLIFEMWFFVLDFFPITFLEHETFFPIVLGTCLTSVGLAITLLQGASSGGTDIIGIMIVKKTPMTYGTFYLISDVIIVILYYFSYDYSMDVALYSVFTIVLFSIVMDLAITSFNRSMQFFIISTKYQEIADFVVKDVDRGATILDAKGWYTKNDKKVLIIVVRQREVGFIMRHVKSIDPHAFVTISKVTSAIGEGFEVNKY